MHAFEHATEEMLEAYSLGTLSEAEVEVLEEHLLICPGCQDRATEMDVFVERIRAAAVKLRQEGKPDAVQAGFFRPARWRWAMLAAAICCLIVLVWVASGTRLQPQPVAVILQTLRGPQEDSAAEAPRGRPLKLEADLTGLPVEGRLRLELVDAGGKPVHQADVTPESNRVPLLLQSGLRQGIYWLRLYRTAPEHELLREYALRVE
jgi:hypothetical protein